MRVKLLDPQTVNQIAAGEVVERPASVVKELLENALDAGAKRITIELEESGTRLIKIADDGHGMCEEDAIAALQRHATSKIRAVEDLHKVTSLGFRGEAIPSIASVSRFELSTAEEDGTRFILPVEGGTPQESRRAPGPRGTTITVEDLFFNTPARLRFLKSPGTELSAITEIASKYAVAFPEVAIRLVHGNNVIFESMGDGDLLSAISAVWGRETARGLAEISTYRDGIRVRGYVSPPHFTRPTRSQQWFYVNGRPVRNRGLFAAIDTAYRQITPEKRYPVALLLIDVDPAKVDMNVSPTKSECKFAHEGAVFDAVRSGIKDALIQGGMMPDMSAVIRANEAIGVGTGVAPSLNFGMPTHFGTFETGLTASPFSGSIVADQTENLNFGHQSFKEKFLDGLRVIGQTADAFFIVAENSQGILIIDQHVAHERILFEKIRAARGQGAVERQRLLTPILVELDRRQYELLAEKQEEISQTGFEFEFFGASSVLVREAPAAIKGQDPGLVIRDLMDEILDGGGASGLSAREQIWVMCSCKMAIKAGDKLTMAEMERLLIDLADSENPYLCPHGRPITITMGKHELLRRFKRA